MIPGFPDKRCGYRKSPNKRRVSIKRRVPNKRRVTEQQLAYTSSSFWIDCEQTSGCF